MEAVTQLDQARPFAERYAQIMSVLADALPVVLATLGASALAVIVPEAAQTGGLLAFKRLVPDLKRLNPVTGIKNLFGLKTLFETAITLAQFSIMLFIVWHACSSFIEMSCSSHLEMSCSGLGMLAGSLRDYGAGHASSDTGDIEHARTRPTEGDPGCGGHRSETWTCCRPAGPDGAADRAAGNPVS
jgi:hypothetical protein